MFNSMIVATISAFKGTITPDKNGEGSIFIQCIAGKMPNRNVRAGTVAKTSGLEIGKTYLLDVREVGYDEVFGTDYTYSKVLELKSAIDIVDTCIKLGPPSVFEVPKPDAAKEYQRKSVAVVGTRTKRIEEGLYRAIGTSTIESSNDTTEKIDVAKTEAKVQTGASIEQEVEIHP